MKDLLETVEKTRTDILRRWRAKKKKKREKEWKEKEGVMKGGERKRMREERGGEEGRKKGGIEMEKGKEGVESDRCAGTHVGFLPKHRRGW